MKLLDVSYELKDSFEQAESVAGPGYLDTLLLRSAPKAPYDRQSMPLVNQPLIVSHSLNSIASARLLTNSRTLTVLDVGGGIGNYYYYALENFGPNLEYDWRVLETSMYVAHGNAYLKYPGIKFIDNLNEIGNLQFDLIHASGSLQYIKDYLAILDSGYVTEAKFVFISRTALSDQEAYYLQTVRFEEGTTFFPARIFAKEDLYSKMSRTHELHASWEATAPMAPAMPFAVYEPSLLWRRRDLFK